MSDTQIEIYVVLMTYTERNRYEVCARTYTHEHFD